MNRTRHLFSSALTKRSEKRGIMVKYNLKRESEVLKTGYFTRNIARFLMLLMVGIMSAAVDMNAADSRNLILFDHTRLPDSLPTSVVGDVPWSNKLRTISFGGGADGQLSSTIDYALPPKPLWALDYSPWPVGSTSVGAPKAWYFNAAFGQNQECYVIHTKLNSISLIGGGAWPIATSSPLYRYQFGPGTGSVDVCSVAVNGTIYVMKNTNATSDLAGGVDMVTVTLGANGTPVNGVVNTIHFPVSAVGITRSWGGMTYGGGKLWLYERMGNGKSYPRVWQIDPVNFTASAVSVDFGGQGIGPYGYGLAYDNGTLYLYSNYGGYLSPPIQDHVIYQFPTTGGTASHTVLPWSNQSNVGYTAFGVGMGFSAPNVPPPSGAPKVDLIVTIGPGGGFDKENGSGVYIGVWRQVITNSPLTVKLNLPGGTATNGIDYDMFPTELTILAGEQASRPQYYSYIDDYLDEGTETITLTIKPDSSYIIGNSPAGVGYIITDNDKPATVTMSNGTWASTTEDGGSLEFKVTRDLFDYSTGLGTVGVDNGYLTVNYQVTGVSATPGVDFVQPTSGTVTFDYNAKEATFYINFINDNTAEPTETFNASLLPGPQQAGPNILPYVLGSPATATGTILDDDAVSVSITAIDSTAKEGGSDNGIFRFTRTGGLWTAISVNVDWTAGSAINGSDFSTLPNVVNIPYDVATVDLTVAVIDDVLPESNETIIGTLQTGADYALLNPISASVTITDNDVKSTVTITATDPIATEGGSDPATFTISRGTANSAALTVFFSATGGTAGSDYPNFPASITIPANAPSVTYSLIPIDDTTAELPETVTVGLASNSLYTLGSPASANATINDNETPVVSITASDATGAEGGTNNGAFTLTRLGNRSAALPVTLSRTGTATAGSDYTAIAASVTIPANSNTLVIPVSVINDVLAEVNETVIATVIAASGYTVGTPTSGTVTISDNDVMPTFTVSIAATDNKATEGGTDNATFTVTRNNISGTPLTVQVQVTGGTATSGSDYPTIAATVTIPADVASATFTLIPTDDATAELAETVIVNVTANAAYVVGSPSSATVTIYDNETPVVSIGASDATGIEGGTNNGAFTLTRLGNWTAALPISLNLAGTAVAGSDYTAIAASVTIPANSNTLIIPVTVLEDTLAESDETVIVTVVAAVGYTVGAPASATVTISDNETPSISIVASDATATEAGQTTGSFTITRLGNKATALTVNLDRTGTAVNGTDYNTIAGTVAMAANVTTVVVTVTPIDDTLLETAETVIGKIIAGTGYVIGVSNTATVTITDNDNQTVTLTATDAAAAELSNVGTFVLHRSGNVTNALTVSYSIVTGAGQAINGTDYSTLSGSITFSALATDSPTITVTPIDDANYEGPETVNLNIVPNAALFVVGSPSAAMVTIADNDKPTVSISLVDGNANEPSDTGKYRLTRNGILSLGSLAVNYAMSGSSLNGTDYTQLTGSVTIPINVATVDITLTPLPDALIEGIESAIMTVSANAAYNVGAVKVATVTIGSSVINTIAGMGGLAYTTTPTMGGQATATGLATPTGIAVDTAGNRYIADGDTNAILKVTAAGVISRFAGNASWAAGFAGDNAKANLASLNNPRGVAVDLAGNVYIADTYNNRIRKVTIATGNISTVAGPGTRLLGDGGIATSAIIRAPTAIALDAAGNLYIADTNNHRIRKIDAATNIITTIAGTGTSGYSGDGASATLATISSPSGVAVDASGNIYIADMNNHRVRKITKTTNVITTVAGNGTAGFSGENTVATAAKLNAPEGVSISPSGELFIADTLNNRVRKLEGPNIVTVAGNGTEDWTGDGGAATSASLFKPVGMAFDATGNLYLADSWNSSIRRLTAGISAIAKRTVTEVEVIILAILKPHDEIDYQR